MIWHRRQGLLMHREGAGRGQVHLRRGQWAKTGRQGQHGCSVIVHPTSEKDTTSFKIKEGSYGIQGKVIFIIPPAWDTFLN